MMKILFNFRPDGRVISTNLGDKRIMAIRKGPRGIVSVIKESELVVIWENDVSDSHINDSEDELIQKTIDVLNS